MANGARAHNNLRTRRRSDRIMGSSRALARRGRGSTEMAMCLHVAPAQRRLWFNEEIESA